jgi:hypothetical protein
MTRYCTDSRCHRTSFAVLLLVFLTGCGSTIVEGLLQYPDGMTSTAGDSVHVRLYGSKTCGATILNVGEDHKWRYPPPSPKRNLRAWSGVPLPPLDPGKGQAAPIFTFQAVKQENEAIVSTQIESVNYPQYKELPDTSRLIRLVYEIPLIPVTKPPEKSDDSEGLPK